MADGALTVKLDDKTAERLGVAARDAGMTPEAYAAATLGEALEPWPSGDAVNTVSAKEALAEYDRTGVFETFQEWSAAFEADIGARLAAKP